VETFLVRVWLPGEEPDRGTESLRHLRGFVERVGSGERVVFHDGEELLEMVREGIGLTTGSLRKRARRGEEG
jgi:hypothetical protein